jgi:hypothetical protein
MSRILITVLLSHFFILTTLTAQTHTHTFELKKATYTQSQSIAYIKVVDQRLQKGNFGYIIDNSTRKQPLITDGQLSIALETFLNNTLRSTPSKNNDTLLFVLRNLLVEHRPAHTNLGTIYVQADFFRGANNQFSQIYHADSFYQLEHRTTKGILNRLNEIVCSYTSTALQDSLLKYKVGTYSFDECISLPETEKKKYPLYSTSEYRKGVYNNWQDVLMQNPAINEFIYLEPDEYGNGKRGLYTVDANGKADNKIDKKDYYAVYDGDWYIRTNRKAYEMILKNGDFYIKVNPFDVHIEIGKDIVPKSFVDPSMHGYGSGLVSYALAGYYVFKLDYKTGNLIPVMITQ